MSWLNPIALTGKTVILEPLSTEHEEALTEAASDGELWNKKTTSVPRPENALAYIQTALQQQADGKSLPFAVRRNSDNEIVGCTRFCNIDAVNRHVEIGYTWYAKSAQRTGVNTETKYLLLRHAFEDLNCIAVEFRTHHLNEQSRTGIARLGAKQDGILRNHRIMPDLSYRHTLSFSIIESEWQDVKKSLEVKMAKYES